jgi:hypothetical protein
MNCNIIEKNTYRLFRIDNRSWVKIFEQMKDNYFDIKINSRSTTIKTRLSFDDIVKILENNFKITGKNI